MKVNLLDLFSGIGGFSKGFQDAGFEIETHLFSEIEPHPIAVYQKHFKEAIYCGSVTTICGHELKRKYDNGHPWIVTLGFPCQDISIAGKRAGLKGKRSSLFFKAMDIVKQMRPPFFIAENVRNLSSNIDGADFKIVLQEIADCGYNAQWQLVNTKWVLPQNRERYYFVGYPATRTRNRPQILFESENVGGINQGTEQTQITGTLTAGGHSGGLHSSMTLIKVGTWRTHKDGQGFREIKDGICPTIPARSREDGSGQPVIRITSNTKSGYETAKIGDSINYNQINSKTRRGRVGKGCSQTLDTTTQIAALTNSGIRRLTPIECERLQGFPDNWTKYGADGKIIKDSPRYEMCGNAVSVPIVEMIAKRIKTAMELDFINWYFYVRSELLKIK
ncbi:DNA (cytosine-5-)-methyltransferase [Lentisphaerota bacterium WC36G]|nr:DNA (cytosine-5-)-methyltransferase [Lentisphaerae bacterium WC36]